MGDLIDAVDLQVDIRELAEGDVAQIAAVNGGNGWNADPALWKQYGLDHASGDRTVLVAWYAHRPVGYVNLVWTSEYAPFQTASIPEINNLSVDLLFRGRGIATALIGACEDKAKLASRSEIGIGVGLYADYGSAMRLYSRLGYQPDGLGVTYADRRVDPGEQVYLDDDLALWFSKLL